MQVATAEDVQRKVSAIDADRWNRISRASDYARVRSEQLAQKRAESAARRKAATDAGRCINEGQGILAALHPAPSPKRDKSGAAIPGAFYSKCDPCRETHRGRGNAGTGRGKWRRP